LQKEAEDDGLAVAVLNRAKPGNEAERDARHQALAA